MSSGLSHDTIQMIVDILNKYPAIDSAILYGSRAKGTYKNGSDIDLTLTGDSLDLSTLNKIRNDFDDLPIPYEIDLSALDQINNSALLDHIKRVGTCFYKKLG